MVLDFTGYEGVLCGSKLSKSYPLPEKYSSKVTILVSRKLLTTSSFFFNILVRLREIGVTDVKLVGCNTRSFQEWKRALLRFKIYLGGVL